MQTDTEYEEYKGYKIAIEHDENPLNPRTDNDNDDLMVCFHKRYDLGDKHKHNYKFQDFGGWDELEAQLIKDHDPVLILPLYLYDHSGITIATSHEYPFNDRWDAGQVGFILLGKKEAKNCYGVKRITKAIKERAAKYIEATVKEYDMYLRGEVYYYRIEDPDGNIIENSGGYIMEAEEVLKEAKLAVDNFINTHTSDKHTKDRIVIDGIEKSAVVSKIQERLDELKDGKVKVTVEVA